MGFSDTQVRALRRNVPLRSIRARVSDGKEFSYIEGWFAIAEANRIFGFDGWDRETIEAKCVQAREVRGTHTVLYTVKVRATVRTGDRVTVREGFGTGEGHGARFAEAHDLALKAAETDATKRALVTFGKAFGLGLYCDARRKVTGDGAGLAKASAQEGLPAGGVRQADAAALVNVPSAVRQRIDKGSLALAEPRRLRDKNHLRHVAAQPCILCNRILADAHHVRFAQPKAFGAKVSDEFTVPLCRDHHRELHNHGDERAWWHEMGVDPLPVAKRLWDESHAVHDANGQQV